MGRICCAAFYLEVLMSDFFEKINWFCGLVEIGNVTNGCRFIKVELFSQARDFLLIMLSECRLGITNHILYPRHAIVLEVILIFTV